MRMFLVLLPLFAGISSVSAQPVEKKPEFAFSAAGKREGRTVAGPLFKKVKADFAQLAEGGSIALDSLVIKNAKLQYYSDISKGPSEKAVLSTDAVKAMTRSCIGPYPYDEGGNWVQLSWVCRTAAETPFSKLVTFRHSPEFSLTIWFENGLIKEIQGMEPLPVPGASRFVMGAADQVSESR